MNARTEHLLNLLLWTCGNLLRPTFRNLTTSYTEWACRNGCLNELHELEARHFLESNQTGPDRRVVRLTKEGRLHALGGRDPEKSWNSRWDGLWRMAIFDVPTEENTNRDRLRRVLKLNGFGCLQRSVWITPHPVKDLRAILKKETARSGSLMVLEGEPCSGEKAEEMIDKAWDFDVIDMAYRAYLDVLEDPPQGPILTERDANNLRAWAQREQRHWLDAVRKDPLLPKVLWPADYLGPEAWQRRMETLSRLGNELRGFHGI